MICSTSVAYNSFHPYLENLFLYFSPFKDARYLYTLIIGHKSFNMLSILNKLTLQRKLHKFVTKCVLDRKVRTKQQQQKHKNHCWSRELNSGPLASKASAPLCQLRVTIVVKLFNWFDAVGQKVNKQSRICNL